MKPRDPGSLQAVSGLLRCLAIVFVIAFVGSPVAQQKLTVPQAAAHIGEQATVCGVPRSISRDPKSPRLLLRFDAPGFTVITPLSEMHGLCELALGRDAVCATGLIEKYEDGAAITLADGAHLTLLLPRAAARPPSSPGTSFEWPPPQWTSRTAVPATLVRPEPNATYGSVFARVQDALRRARIRDWSVYRIAEPYDGFVVVASMEHIDEAGKPLPDRFVVNAYPPRTGFLQCLLQALFNAPRGRYRVITFAFTEAPIVANAQRKPDEIKELVSGGPDALAPDFGAMAAPEAARCVALVYEFAREVNRDPFWLDPQSSAIDPRDHLALAGMWSREQLQ